MENSRSAYVKKRIVRTGLICRTLVLAVPVLSRLLGGLRVDEFEIVLLMMLPVSCLFFTLLIKFVIRNKYLLKGVAFDNFYIVFGRLFLLALTLAEVLILVCKSLYGLPDDGIFYALIGFIESGFGIYAGFYLSDIFRAQNVEKF